MPDPVIAIVRAADADPIGLLERAIVESGLRERLGDKLAGKDKASAIVVPALDAFAAGSPVATDPELVEYLLDVLFDLGVTNASVGSTHDSSALWLENRDPFMIADLLGYRYETPAGRPYDVIDLAEDLAEAPFAETGPLAGAMLARAWMAADIRIVFAKNRTDEDDGYALCLSTLLSVLPLRDKDYHYRHRRDPGAVAAALLEAAPIDFAFIDAVESAHGPGGLGAPHPITTGTIIAAFSPALADHHGALLMGLDPFISRTAGPSLRRAGLLDGLRTIGSLDPYPGWINVDPLQREAVRLRRQSDAIDRAVRPLVARVDRELFPFSNPAIDRINSAVAPMLAEAAGRGDGKLLAQLNFWLGQIGFADRAWATHFDKDRLRRCEKPINVDPQSVSPAEFAALAGELDGLTQLLRGIAADETGLRWRTHDKAILFDGVRRYPIAFDAFVSAVEINRTIQYMNDYIGGSALAVERDEQGMVTRQIERNLYLPQPNYTMLLGGDAIDVTKIEAISYAPQRQQMVWKTIRSENDSALADDGIVVFEALGSDTLVSIFGRQLFRLPPILEAIDLDLVPGLKAILVTDAYRRFFRRTFANLEAVAEGRDVRIGRPWAEDEIGGPLLADRLVDLVSALGNHEGFDVLERIKSIARRPEKSLSPVRIDEDGFHHFDGRQLRQPIRQSPMPVNDLFGDLWHAARVDAGLVR